MKRGSFLTKTKGRDTRLENFVSLCYNFFVYNLDLQETEKVNQEIVTNKNVSNIYCIPSKIYRKKGIQKIMTIINISNKRGCSLAGRTHALHA